MLLRSLLLDLNHTGMQANMQLVKIVINMRYGTLCELLSHLIKVLFTEGNNGSQKYAD